MTKEPNPHYNPGVKSDTGRLIVILFIAGLVYWIYHALTVPEKNFEVEMEKINEETVSSDFEFEFSTSTIDSDLPEEVKVEILEKVQEKMQELEESGAM